MIRKAQIKDVRAIHSLLQQYGSKGELLPRPLSKLYDHIRDFLVYIEAPDETLLGCCALQICWEDMAEIRSLAVHPLHQKKKIGAQLVEAALTDARSFNVAKVFTLTYQPEFFRKYGFSRIEISDLPLKIWGDCLSCVKFPNCDETAMMMDLHRPALSA